MERINCRLVEMLDVVIIEMFQMTIFDPRQFQWVKAWSEEGRAAGAATGWERTANPVPDFAQDILNEVVSNCLAGQCVNHH